MADPWELLKRAREHVKAQFDALDYCGGTDDCHCSNAQEVYCLLEEIDSAIKHHEENIGWIRQGSWGRYQGEYGEAFINPAPKATVGYTFFWRVFRKSPKGHRHDGYAKSYEEAQRLATQVLRENQDG